MARLFVAVWPPPAVTDPIAAISRPEAAGVRWSTAHQWHVTLRFLGRADPDEAVAALERLVAPAADAVVTPVPEMLGGGALVLPVDGLDELAAAVEAATADIGDVRARPEFRGHLTLARTRSGFVPGLAPLAGAVVFRVDEIALVESDTRPDGARYRDVARFGLTAG